MGKSVAVKLKVSKNYVSLHQRRRVAEQQDGATPRDEVVEGISRLFDDYDVENFERVWQSLFKRYDHFGSNDFEVMLGGTKKRQRGET